MATRSPKEIADKARTLFDARYCWSTPVRAVTVSAIYLCPELTPQQLDIFSDAEKAEKQDKLDSAVDELRQRFGKGIIRPASTLGDIKIPDDGRDLVRMPGLMFQ
jgi:DNA polymerase-4